MARFMTFLLDIFKKLMDGFKLQNWINLASLEKLIHFAFWKNSTASVFD